MARTIFVTVSLSQLLLLAPLLSLTHIAHASCYYPSGGLAPNDVPCTDKTPNAACCGQGYACLSNGICQATGEELQKPGATKFVRGSCTDKNWRSSNCPLFCMDPKADNVGGGEGIFKCPNTTKDLYYCINGYNLNTLNGTNCQTGTNVLFFPGTPSAITTIGVAQETTSTQPSSTSSAPTTTSAATTTSSSTQGTTINTAPADPKTTGELPAPTSNNGAVIGGAVGGSIGGIALVGLLGWLFWRRKKSQTQAAIPMYEADATPVAPVAMKPVEPSYAPVVHEAPDWSAYNHNQSQYGSHSQVYEAP
ncbi:hypothetical protein PT974_04588 [Cladobotryum mycophilum]|uniref:Mid2 domain-containing protein n=1 Tax=Cladobotryum mycophilum TaxID=491253 RepID=A0ABR0SVD3_9HYPO